MRFSCQATFSEWMHKDAGLQLEYTETCGARNLCYNAWRH